MEEENKTIIKALDMYGRVPEMWELLEEVERLNNIINELEKYIVYQLKILNNPDDYYTGTYVRDILYRLKELKGSDK